MGVGGRESAIEEEAKEKRKKERGQVQATTGDTVTSNNASNKLALGLR